jgi:hypothetical protein
MPSADVEFRICQELSGVTETPRKLVVSVIRRARIKFGADPVDQMIKAYMIGGASALLSDPVHAGIARAIVYCLYTGLLPDTTGAAATIDATGTAALTAEDHFQALMWRVIQAHPPALSGGYFGHWHYPPEDA